MKKSIVVYFSAQGATKKIAERLSAAIEAPIHEITPKIPYTTADLNWQDPNSRSSVEMHNHASRPEIDESPCDLSQAEVVFLGFPIWWYIAPTIINTFLEKHDCSGKTIVLFATSGGSGFGKAVANLQPSAPGAVFLEGKVFSALTDKDTLKTFAESYL